MRRQAFVVFVLWIAAVTLEARPSRKYMVPESLTNWQAVLDLSRQLTSAQVKTQADARTRLLAMGRSAIHPLLAISVRSLPQSRAVQELLPAFGLDDLVAEAVDVVIIDADRSPCRVVGGMGKSVLHKMRELLEEDETYAQEGRRFAICVLTEMGSEGVPTLIDLAKSTNPRVRGAALSTLTMSSDPRAGPLFLEALQSTVEGVRRFGASGLVRQPDRRAVPDLLRMIDEPSTVADYQQTAMYALRGVYAPDLRLPIAKHAWTNRVRSMRQAAADTLSASNDRVAIRLGARYAPRRYVPSLPYYEWGPRISFGICCLCFCVILGVRVSLWIGAFLSGLVGVYWGYFAKDLWIYSEAFLIAVFVPSALAALWFCGARWRFLLIALVWFLCQWILPLTFAGPLMFYGPIVETIVQYEGLILALPAVAVAALVRERDAERLKASRRSVSHAAAGFYAGYGVSFAALWGYLGF